MVVILPHGCDEVKQVAGYTLPVALHDTQHRIVCHTKGRIARVRAKSDEGVRNCKPGPDRSRTTSRSRSQNLQRTFRICFLWTFTYDFID